MYGLTHLHFSKFRPIFQKGVDQLLYIFLNLGQNFKKHFEIFFCPLHFSKIMLKFQKNAWNSPFTFFKILVKNTKKSDKIILAKNFSTVTVS